MGLSLFYGKPPPDEERLRLLDRAHELGCIHWDSAALYGDSEDFVGEIFMATKFGNHRLNIDYIDLLYCHRISGKTPIEDVVETMKEFVISGQVRYLGISECEAYTLRHGSEVFPIHAYQIEYSPFSMDIEQPGIDLDKACRELRIAIVAYSPIGRGILTGQYKSPDDFAEGDFRRTVPLVDKIKAIADRKGCTSGQLTLAWMIKQELVFPIPDTKRIEYLEREFATNDICLTPTDKEEKEIREAIEKAEVHRTWYPTAMMGALIKDTPPRQ
ncbi:Aldo-keto reductase yakc [NADP(+)] [Madurella mycetomatis]|uniref:Aldo-keto reductase yakc [NADP(+)] n=1 Tax=Madurella mycetomatis TaxID=100816 RepID=A0A175WFQ9_9PEZI|nr:Aldo-keto reductase yakc [NADP(+)] [Madurella mycetomatis]KXX82486.1 Aldo-keto reductase yakc [NADP(+)] [Madurella mycetomatis]